MKLEVGYHHPFEVRKEKYLANCIENFSILYLSDLHFNAYGQYLAEALICKIAALNPTIILLGGDYVDTKKGTHYFNVLLHELSARDHVFAIAGNHDYFFGIKKIESMLTANHVCWIEKKSVVLKYKDLTIGIDGNRLNTQKPDTGFSILCLHKPVDLAPYSNNYDLAFAGHLHGCQAVLWESEKGMYPGRFFYKWNIQKVPFGKCRYYISKVLGDTVPVRYNCPKDILFIEVISNTIK